MDQFGALGSLDLTGSPRERGLIHGESLRGEIELSLSRWSEQLAVEGQRSSASGDDPVRSLARSSGFVSAMEEHTPDLVDELRGIAEGSGQELESIVGLNLMDEEVWLSDRERPESCTSLACRAEDGLVLAGQTMDLTARHDGLQVLLRIPGRSGEALILSSPGMLGLCGVSAGGFAVFCNQLVQLATSTTGLPVAAVTRMALTAESLSAAREWIGAAPHATGQNYLLASFDAIVCLEASALGVAEVLPDGSGIVHTNHPLSEEAGYATGLDGSVDGGFSAGSHDRLEYVRRRLPGNADEAGIRELFRDRSVPICKVPADGGDELTFGAVMAELGRSGTRAWFTPGPPDRTEWVGFNPSFEVSHQPE